MGKTCCTSLSMPVSVVSFLHHNVKVVIHLYMDYNLLDVTIHGKKATESPTLVHG